LEDAEEVVLPFFVANQQSGKIRQCNCRVDPETGFVIHSCMTPATTMCDNTQAFQSYVCSEWGSRRASRRNSFQKRSSAKSRRASVDGSENEEEENDEEQDTRRRKDDHLKQKRIRNASMLAVVGKAAPAPAKQDTDAISTDKDGKDSGSDDEKPEENELSVSFKMIGRTSMDDGVMDGSPGECPSVEKQPKTSAGGNKTLDQVTEGDLCHRFEMLQPVTLAEMLAESETREQILVVDARGRDWVGAHIPLSINLRTSEICNHPESLISQCQRNRIDHLVFTCMYSVLRARKSAVAVQRAQEDAHKSGLQPYRIRISLLAGGMHAWVNHFVEKIGAADMEKQNPYIQDFDASSWCDGGPSQGGLVHVMDALWSQGGQQALSDALIAELSSLAFANLSNTPSASGHASVAASGKSSRRASSEMDHKPMQAPGHQPAKALTPEKSEKDQDNSPQGSPKGATQSQLTELRSSLKRSSDDEVGPRLSQKRVSVLLPGQAPISQACSTAVTSPDFSSSMSPEEEDDAEREEAMDTMAEQDIPDFLPLDSSIDHGLSTVPEINPSASFATSSEENAAAAEAALALALATAAASSIVTEASRIPAA